MVSNKNTAWKLALLTAYLNFESEIEFLPWKSLIDTLSQASRNNSAVTVETEDAPVQSNRDEGLTHM